MKELTIEEKAKRYDESLERMRDFLKEWEDCGAVGTAMEKAEAVFPELRESKDERIRKELIVYCQVNMGDTWHSIKQEDYIAWLEKQGEHANFRNKIQIGDKVTRNKDGVLVNLSQLKRVAKPADKVEPKFKIGQTIVYKGSENIAPTKMTISDIVKGQYWDDNCCIVPISDQDNWELEKPSTIKFNEPDIEEMVEDFWHNKDVIISSHTRGMVEEAYRQGLEDMYKRLKGD